MTVANKSSHKVGLLNLAEELGNVSKACQIMGISRDTFYRYKAALINYAVNEPAHGQQRASNEQRKKAVPFHKVTYSQ